MLQGDLLFDVERFELYIEKSNNSPQTIQCELANQRPGGLQNMQGWQVSFLFEANLLKNRGKYLVNPLPPRIIFQ